MTLAVVIVTAVLYFFMLYTGYKIKKNKKVQSSNYTHSGIS
jgi:hypothetical protein